MKCKYLSLWLCAVIVAVFVFQQIFPSLTDNFMLISGDVLTRPWILLTSIFLHSGVLHLLYNLFALAMFGLLAERIIGSKRFLILFIASGIAASICSCFIYHAALGASGAIFGVMGCLAMLRPRGVVFVSGMLLPLWLAAFVWAAFDIMGLFAPSNVANLAHLVGLACGLCYGLVLRKQFAEKKRFERKIQLSEDDEKAIGVWEDRYVKR